MKDKDALNMIKVWLALEVRQFITALIQDVCIRWLPVGFTHLLILNTSNHRFTLYARRICLVPTFRYGCVLATTSICSPGEKLRHLSNKKLERNSREPPSLGFDSSYIRKICLLIK